MDENRPQLTRNAVRCNACGDVIESRHRHDLVHCQCRETLVDGGLDYPRRGHGQAGFTELAEYAAKA